MSDNTKTAPPGGLSAKQRRTFLVGSVLVALLALGGIASVDMSDNLVYFWEPRELYAAGDDAYGAQIRLGGLVKEGTLNWDEGAQELKMVVTDGQARGDGARHGRPAADVAGGHRRRRRGHDDPRGRV
jgi:hypothetical protein